MKLAFDNITISGGVAVGKTSLFNNLKPYLTPLHWQFEAIGDIHREYLKDNIMPEATKVSDEFDLKIEKFVEKKLRLEKYHVIAAWLSGFVARNLTNTLRILLTCQDNSLRVDRVANRDRISVEEAKKFIKQREEGNIGKYKRLYGDVNFWNPTYYQLVIDTYAHSQLETVNKVLDKLEYKYTV